jgi:predicted PurR-regulated permease PerM
MMGAVLIFITFVICVSGGWYLMGTVGAILGVLLSVLVVVVGLLLYGLSDLRDGDARPILD